MTNTQRTLNAIDQAIQMHMQLLEHHLTDMLENINEARHALNHRSRNGAVGTLLHCEEAYKQISTLYHAIIALHRTSDAIERPDDD
jgi:23S rRNA maturation mini-RNase III